MRGLIGLLPLIGGWVGFGDAPGLGISLTPAGRFGLLEAVRDWCHARAPARLLGRPWLGQMEPVAGDCLRAETLPSAMQGVEVALCLAHNIAGGQHFEQRDVLAARNFGSAARLAGVPRRAGGRPQVAPRSDGSES